MINLCDSIEEVKKVRVRDSPNTPILRLLCQAEWLAAQRDEQGMADLGDEEEEGVSFCYWIIN